MKKAVKDMEKKKYLKVVKKVDAYFDNWNSNS